MQRGFGPFLAFLIGLVFLCDAAVVTVHVLNDHTTLIRGTPITVPTQGTEVQVVPGAGQEFVTGTINQLAADNAQVQPIPSPLTISAVNRGVGRLSITGALVGGKRMTITWDGGTPLPISGTGGLDVGTVHVDASASGIVYTLDGAARAFVPGTYTLGATVAVGSGSGLASPQDSVKFTADSQTALNTQNGVVVHVDPQKLDLLGPGKVTMSGKLKVQYPDHTANASSVTLDSGPYRVSLGVADSGLTVDAILQGSVDAS